MLRSGEQYLDSLRDGRTIYIGGERVDDVTSHPAFRRTARSFAALYDLKASPKHRGVMAFEEHGEAYSAYFHMPRTREDLVRRMQAHKLWADASYGLLGRSPDHVASFVTALAMQPEVLARGERPFGDHVRRYWREMRERDLFAAYAVVPPQAARDAAFYVRRQLRVPTLRVTAEDDTGVTLNGMKMLGTSAVFADDVWIGNLHPLAPDQLKESITCAVSVGTPGVSLWARKSFEQAAVSDVDNPLSSRFDETDSMIVFDDVHVPWERVFCHDDPVASRETYFRTASHSFGNHQANVRFWSKLQVLIGLASRVAQANGADRIPAVRETLGRLAGHEAGLAATIWGQCADYEPVGDGYVGPNRRYVYAALSWSTEMHSTICDTVRELCGGGVFQVPADISVLDDPHLREVFEEYWQTPTHSAAERMKLFKLAWDLLGSEFAGRHLQYEKFYAGPRHIVTGYSDRTAPWDDFHRVVDEILAATQVGDASPTST